MDDQDLTREGSPEIPARPQSVVNIDVDVQVTGINSRFYLSDERDFKVDLERFCIPLGGEVIDAENGRQATIEFLGYHGRCVVQYDGLVKCSGQLSFAEVGAVTAKVIWKLRAFCRQQVGLYRQSFQTLTALSILPFRVSLNLMKRKDPGLIFLAEIKPPSATLTFDNERTTIQMYSSGKLVITSSSDFESRDDGLPELAKALQQAAVTAHACAIYSDQESTECEPQEESLKTSSEQDRYLHKPRRSNRLARLTAAKLKEAARSVKNDCPAPEELRELRKRLFLFFDAFTNIWSCKILATALNEVLLSQTLSVETADAFSLVGRYFSSAVSSGSQLAVPSNGITSPERHSKRKPEMKSSLAESYQPVHLPHRHAKSAKRI